ncbi:proteasome 26S subunit [Fomitiporia mediterranea MF3/22]|uniref:proteasome 26S subunit n=1 Tax=Fomitiporia mediterranea (strain MF3/22) TaxID=694068 RepID=UPI0004407B1E|nr:proteasome 26S subunit [Fomitiporia mediterranea MF3/22]EJD02499.1 proteasome 26S subunit [Fomitiporia mediterranea MF3/22]
MAEEVILPIPNLELPQAHFTLNQSQLGHLHQDALKVLLQGIEKDHMAPYYRALIVLQHPPTSPSAPSSPTTSRHMQIPLPEDKALLERMDAANAEELKKLDERLEEAEKTEGETEIADALRARAMYLTRIGDKDKAIAAQELAFEKTPGVGSKIDIVLTLVRIGFFFGDHVIISKNLTRAEELIEKGGDWDRRNRLKVYQGLHSLSIRQFKRATDLFVDALSTFTATELLNYNDFVSMTMIAGALTLSRPDLKKKIINAPEVIQVIQELPILAELTKSLYDCLYDRFFIALAKLEQTQLIPSRVLNPHARYYVREMRILAYAQLLESYRSLTLESLATAFGVSVPFVDNELARFIALGRLNCTIDRVHGIVETNRPSAKNSQYETVIRQGDILLNSIQKLSKVLY